MMIVSLLYLNILFFFLLCCFVIQVQSTHVIFMWYMFLSLLIVMYKINV